MRLKESYFVNFKREIFFLLIKIINHLNKKSSHKHFEVENISTKTKT